MILSNWLRPDIKVYMCLPERQKWNQETRQQSTDVFKDEDYNTFDDNANSIRVQTKF